MDADKRYMHVMFRDVLVKGATACELGYKSTRFVRMDNVSYTS